MKRLAFVALALLAGCVSERRFPLREPMLRDTDLRAVNARCHRAPTSRDPSHVSCAPEPYESPIYWDGLDNMFFRPLSNALGFVTSGESVNVNALDEVPDSAWFTNRIGARPLSIDDFSRGACTPEQILDPDHAADGTWLIDKGKMEGSTPGFRVVVPGKGKFMLKMESQDDEPERQSASTVIGTAVYWAAGYYATCEQVLWVRPSIFKLAPGLRQKRNFTPEEALDQRALDAMLSQSTKRGGLVRLGASAWIPGYAIGPARSVGTRDDDPNDVIPHEDRRDLRGMRVLAAWIDRFDAREENSFDTWKTARAGGPPDASPGVVLHYQIDTSETLGSLWAWDAISRRLGSSYIIDWGDIAADFFSLGAVPRPWDTARVTPGQEIFGYFNARDFDPDAWKSEYPNAAFSRMTERDAAWMARILARFTPEMVRELARMGRFSDESHTRYLAAVLEGRLERILDRWLTRLSPIGELRVEGESLCGVDLAAMRRVRDPSRFRWAAKVTGGAALAVTVGDAGRVCVALPRVGAGGYLRVVVTDGVARGPLVAHVYDVGSNGFRLAGVERPASE